MKSTISITCGLSGVSLRAILDPLLEGAFFREQQTISGAQIVDLVAR